MFRKKYYLGGLAVLLGIVAGATTPSKAAGPTATFASVVNLHYARWASGAPGGTLTAARVAALVNNIQVRGEEAMAIAAIHHYFVSKSAPQVVGENFLLAPKNSSAQSTLADFQGRFSKYCNSLKTTPRTLFANGAPTRQGLHQSGVGDCYLMCTLGAFVTVQPGQLQNMIQPQTDGSYLVMFPNHPVRVPPLTDAQIVLDENTAGNQGLWIKVMGEAYAITRQKAGSPAVAIDDLGGGSCIPVIALLTGQQQSQIQHILPTALAATNKAAAERAAENLLLEVHQHKLVACASTASNSPTFSNNFNPHKIAGGKWTLGVTPTVNYPLPPGIAGRHAYGVLDYDPSRKLVTVWNPWGGSWQPTGTPGFANGYPRTNGVFQVPLCDFVRIFHGFEVQAYMPSSKPVLATGLPKRAHR